MNVSRRLGSVTIALVIAAGMTLAVSPHAAATAAAKAPAPCSGPLHKQFDFWAGRWRVTDRATGKFDGTNEVTRELNGCVLQEHWSGSGGSHGSSFNLYDASRKVWHQTWVDNGGGILQLDGGLHDRSMILSGTRHAASGKPVIDRITWTPQRDGSVRQWWQTSNDGGRTWKTAFDGIYRRSV